MLYNFSMELKYIKNKKDNYISVNDILKMEFNISTRLLTKLINQKNVKLNNKICDTREHVKIDDIVTVNMEFEEEDERSWSSFRYATVDFTVDDQNQEDDLNRTLRLSLWDGSRKPGWEIRTECNPAISSLRHLDKFDLLMVRLQRADVRVIDDVHHEDDYVYSDTKPEPTYE